MADRLVVHGAREHNLKNVSLDLPRDSLIVFTGLSGSGKSSLAFDTIFAEGQRRYVESLSAYARQFLGQMDKPDVDFIEGLSPAVSIDQKSTSRNPRSTVGTITEVYDYLRLLYARAGRPHCPKCGRPISRQTPQQIVDRVLEMTEGTRFQVLAPVIRGRKGEYVDLFGELQAKGFSRVRVDGVVHQLTDPPKLKKQEKHTIEVVVDRLSVKASAKQRMTDSVETALKLANGIVLLEFVHDAVDARAHETLRTQLFEDLHVFALAFAHDWRDQHVAFFRVERERRVDHLADRLRLERDAVVGAAWRADAREQQAQVVVDLGDRADGRARVVRGRLLLDRDRRRKAFDVIDVGLLHHRQELARIGRQRLDIATLPLRVDRVERERGLARAGQPGDHDQPVARQIEVDVLEIVRARTADAYRVHAAGEMGEEGDYNNRRLSVRDDRPRGRRSGQAGRVGVRRGAVRRVGVGPKSPGSVR